MPLKDLQVPCSLMSPCQLHGGSQEMCLCSLHSCLLAGVQQLSTALDHSKIVANLEGGVLFCEAVQGLAEVSAGVPRLGCDGQAHDGLWHCHAGHGVPAGQQYGMSITGKVPKAVWVASLDSIRRQQTSFALNQGCFPPCHSCASCPTQSSARDSEASHSP